jgi:hypothetical protein
VKDGLAEAFRSNQTPSFAEMVSTLFANSNPEQKAGLLQRLLGVAGPYAANGPIEKVFGSKFPKGVQQVSPAEASQVSPDEVKRLAAHAQNEKESIVDEIAGFYSQHPQVVTALGGLALSVAIQHMARRA